MIFTKPKTSTIILVSGAVISLTLAIHEDAGKLTFVLIGSVFALGAVVNSMKDKGEHYLNKGEK